MKNAMLAGVLWCGILGLAPMAMASETSGGRSAEQASCCGSGACGSGCCGTPKKQAPSDKLAQPVETKATGAIGVKQATPPRP